MDRSFSCSQKLRFNLTTLFRKGLINQSIIDVHVDDLKPYENEVTPDSWLEDRESQETTKINENSANDETNGSFELGR